MYQITHLCKFGVNWSSKLQENIERKYYSYIVVYDCLLSDAWERLMSEAFLKCSEVIFYCIFHFWSNYQKVFLPVIFFTQVGKQPESFSISCHLYTCVMQRSRVFPNRPNRNHGRSLIQTQKPYFIEWLCFVYQVIVFAAFVYIAKVSENLNVVSKNRVLQTCTLLWTTQIVLRRFLFHLNQFLFIVLIYFNLKKE